MEEMNTTNMPNDVQMTITELNSSPIDESDTQNMEVKTDKPFDESSIKIIECRGEPLRETMGKVLENKIPVYAEEYHPEEVTTSGDTIPNDRETIDMSGTTENETVPEPEKVDINSLTQMMVTTQQTMNIMKDLWLQTAQALDINGEHVRKLAEYNYEHKKEMPEDISEEDKEKWDFCNGLDNITMDELKSILGDNHPSLINVNENDARESIKNVMQIYVDYARSAREYDMIHKAYMEYLNESEAEEIKKFEERAANETDPEKKKILEDQIAQYYRIKRLDFLAEPLSDFHKKRIQSGFVNASKATYWVNRTQEKLKQMKINPEFVMTLYHFEERFLEPKYRKLNNALLFYFTNFAIYAKVGDPNDEKMNITRCFFMSIITLFNKSIKEDEREYLLDNIRKFEDQLLDYIQPGEKETIPAPVFG